jgi:hypothetical protein
MTTRKPIKASIQNWTVTLTVTDQPADGEAPFTGAEISDALNAALNHIPAGLTVHVDRMEYQGVGQ